MNNLFDALKTDHEAGFRLSYAEFFNWGTFSNTYKGELIAVPHCITPNAQTVALQGKKGSGKSTVVDGLITLLVPSPRRKHLLYNQASGTSEDNQKSKGRTDETYFWGYYKETIDEDDNIKSKALREVKDNHHTVILACFDNGHQRFTLAQVWFWKTDTIKKMYIVSSKALKIEEHFASLGYDTKKLRTQFESFSPDTRVFTDDFKGYQNYFRELFGIKSEDALKLFHKIVGSKELGSVDRVVKDFILQDGTEAIENRIEEMNRSNDTLIKIKNMMDAAERQLSLLNPIVEESKDFKMLNDEIERLEILIKQLPNYMTVQREKLLSQEIESSNKELKTLESRLAEIKNSLDSLRKEEIKINTVKDGIDIQKIIESKEEELKRINEEVKGKKEKAGNYEVLAKELAYLINVETEKVFKSNQKYAETEKGKIENDIINGENVLTDLKAEVKVITPQYEAKIKELKDLESRPNSNIPTDNQKIRERIIKELGIKENAIPFIGELIQVGPNFRNWENAIEKLLRSFALNMLVLEKYEKRVNYFVNQNNLKWIATYKIVQSSNINNSFSNPDEDGVFKKLEIKGEEPFYGYLKKVLLRDFDYECFDEDDDNFRKTDKGITIKGLQNQKGGNYRKDDRTGMRPVLGWDTFANIELVRKEADELFSQKGSIEKKVVNQRTELDKQKAKFEKIKEFLKIEMFSEIDYKKEEITANKLESDINKLKETPKNKEFEELQRQLRGILKQIKETEEEQLQKSVVKTNTETRNVAFTSLLEETQKQIETILMGDFEEFMSDYDAYFKDNILNNDNFELQQERAKNKFKTNLQAKITNRDEKKTQIEGFMKDYLREFPNSSLTGRVDNLSDFEKRHYDIQYEDLERYKAEFELNLKEDFTHSFINFKNFLEETQLNQIEKDIRETNLMLKDNKFDHNFYLQLEKKEGGASDDIRAFRKRLKDVLEGGIGINSEQSQLELRFSKIQSLLDDFKYNQKTKMRLTDVRNWVSIYVNKYKWGTKDSESIHQDSSSKSGGQQTELTYAILSSAIAKQFGLSYNPQNSNSKSFRFVILDEAFSKLDSDTPASIMQMFKELRLQLMVVIPDREKLNLIPDYLGWIHFVSNSVEGSKSEIAQIQLDYNPQKLIEIGS